MRRGIAAILLISFLFVMTTGCGDKVVVSDLEESTQAQISSVSESPAQQLTFVPADTLSSYIQQPFTLPNVIESSDSVICKSNALFYAYQKNNVQYIGRSDLLFNESIEFQIGDVSEEAMPISIFFGADIIYCQWGYAEGTALRASKITATDYSGEMLWDIDVNALAQEFGIDAESMFISGIGGNEGRTIFTVDDSVYFWNGEKCTAQEKIAGATLQIVYSGTGKLYLVDQQRCALYEVNSDTGTIGEERVAFDSGTTICQGDNAFDFYAIGTDTVWGLSLKDNTYCEVLSLGKCKTDIRIDSITRYNDTTWALSGLDPLAQSQCAVLLCKSDATSKEEITLTMAVPLPSYVPSWTQYGDTFLQSMIDRFNLENEACHIETETYSSASDLQLLMLSETPPDLILFGTFPDTEAPSEQIYAAKGYLVDLETLMLESATFSKDDFVPGWWNAMTSTSGALYTIAPGFYYRTLAGLPAAVGNDEGWDLNKFLQIAEASQTDYILAMSSREFLETMLQHCVSAFADINNATCDFQTETFYRLLRLAKERFPADSTAIDPGAYEPQALQDNTVLLQSTATIGGISAAADMMKTYGNCTMIGYPGAGGNGGDIVTNYNIGISTMSQHDDLAWSFIERLLDYSFQRNCLGMYFPARKDVLIDIIESYEGIDPDFTSNYGDSVYQMIENASNRTIYDSPVVSIIMEEVDAFLVGDKSAEAVADIIQNRVSIYLSEQK